MRDDCHLFMVYVLFSFLFFSINPVNSFSINNENTTMINASDVLDTSNDRLLFSLFSIISTISYPPIGLFILIILYTLYQCFRGCCAVCGDASRDFFGMIEASTTVEPLNSQEGIEGLAI